MYQCFTSIKITMPKKSYDKLSLLIISLTKAEKRSFRLYVNRSSDNGDSKFVQLFNQIEKDGNYNEEKILKKLPQIKKRQLSNLKANLFRQILTCLRLLERTKITEIDVREQIDFAKILYEKGLYKSCLELLDKAKKMALSINYETLALSILYFEKRIETQHVTGSMAITAEKLALQSNEILEGINLTNSLSNLSLLLYGRYLKHGYVKNEDDYLQLKVFFNKHLPEYELDELKFYQKLYLYQCYVWFYNMTQDFPLYYKYANRWVNIFHNNEELIVESTPLFMKGIHNLMNALFMSGKREKYNETFNYYKKYDIHKKTNATRNEISNYYLFFHIHNLNRLIINGLYDNSATELEEITNLLEKNPYNWDNSRILAFYYKMACVYFGDNDLNNCIDCLNKVTYKSMPAFREDIQCFASILNLIAHFDLGNIALVNYKLRSLYRFLSKMKDLEKVQLEIIKFLRRTPNMEASKMKTEFKNLRDRLQIIGTEKYEKRPFLYLDIISWLEAKIEDTTIGTIIKRKINSDV